ncbi:DUF5995 family protein [Lewinella sp. IMCC34191]|uniref:DUF5995 family protein n=1 Tax=Lewinella sp. IMCC34191 TaxID=2259172 RepID=UPI000E2703D3|nr:DUF5995 family protein [Lewinella sp. IMCC34191]
MDQQTDILQRMDGRVNEWKSTGDARHVFLGCYRMMTGGMLEAIDANVFHDREWISELLHRFAGYYFDALTCYDCGDRVPEVWRHVHEVSAKQDLREVQHLLLGVNAHINYDLVLTLCDMLEREWNDLPPEQRKIRYADHCRVNEVIAGTIDRVQDQILAPNDPVMGWLDRACGRLDEYLIAGLIRRWREEVWQRARTLLTETDAMGRERLRKELEADVLRRGRLLAWSV